MDAERWRRVEQLFHSALALEEGKRSAFLRDSCAGDQALRLEVNALIACHDQEQDFLETPALDVMARQMAVSDPGDAAVMGAEPGQIIGPYLLVQLLGSGGMGEVWHAQQSKPIRRTVALKLIKFGMDTRAVVARFDSERQALALMDHPNVAKVFDAGATPTGRPYFVMELVPGTPITQYCDQHRLTIKERLTLFLQVCEGVQHAHQKAIIHRDLKPSNILVQEVDGRPIPKIIDFGLAKATSADGAERSMFTELGLLVGTPSYMSPEQVGAYQGSVDTRTDVYSLGVTLFELLVGAPPVDRKELELAGPAAMLRRIREAAVPRPSAKFAALGGNSADLAAARSATKSSLLRQLHGDLDWITLRAIEKDRDRRYGSPSELAADLRRHLADQPVLAGPPSASYRIGKFVRRHRIGVTVAAVATALTIAVAANMLVQARRVARERDRASREAEAAKRVSDFLIGLFRVSDPAQARGNTITARELLDRGRTQIETELSGQPEVQARMMDTVGQVYFSLGLYEQAEPSLQRALATRRSILGAEHPDTLATVDHVVQDLERQGRYAEAEKLATESLDTRLRVLGPNHPDTISSRHAIMVLTIDKGDYAGAEKLCREELDMLRRVRGPEHPTTLDSMSNLALVISNQGRYAEALPLYRQLLEIRRRVLGPTHPDTLLTMSPLGNALAELGKYEEAEELLRDSIESKRRILGPEHSETLWSMHNLANTLRAAGRPADAESLDRQALSIRRRVLGPEHPETLMSLTGLAEDLDDLHRFREAEQLYRESLATERRVLGPNHPETAVTKYNLACNLALTGRPRDALALLNDAVDHGLPPGNALSIESDSDFKSLRGTPGFVALVARIRQRPSPVPQH
jgi:non-specific serine/threonine protein kinase/serine/threonine-protein kinase